MTVKRFEYLTTHNLDQFEKPLFSTVELEKFLKKHGCFQSQSVMEIGCGPATVLNYLARLHPRLHFTGIDYNEYVIEKAQKIKANQVLENLRLTTGDWFDLSPDLRNQFEGIFSVYALCCMKRVEPAIEHLTKLNPQWIAFNSLFYEGPLDVLIHIRDHHNPQYTDDIPDGDFNIFSLPLVKDCFAKAGYGEFHFERFEMPQSLPKPPDGNRGTYTIETEISPHTQFSGPVHLPWYFVLAKKKG